MTAMEDNLLTNEHLSPGQLAFRRFKKNKLAVLGAVLLVLMTLGVVFVPLFSEHDPEKTHGWIQNKPPGFSHPDCSEENSFVVGKKVDSSDALKNLSKLTISVVEQERAEYRVVLKLDGKIDRIKHGADDFTELDLNSFPGAVYGRNSKDAQPQVLSKQVLTVGKLPPAGFFKDSTRVLLFDVNSDADPKSYEANIEITNSGEVKSIAVINSNNDDVKSVQSLDIAGEYIRSIKGDNRILEKSHLLGTDHMGRDLFVRIFYGGRISILVGIVATVVSLLIGLIYGAISGFFGGLTDRYMMGAVDILYALPFVFLVILLMVSFGQDIFILFIALGCVQWLTMSRIVRGQILSLRAMPYIEAARMSGATNGQIIFRHLIPHTLGPVVIYTTLTVPVVIMEESFLAFIGLQVEYNNRALDSWGALIHMGMKQLGESGERSWMLIFPALAMVITLFGLNCLGDGLRDCFDPKRGKS